MEIDVRRACGSMCWFISYVYSSCQQTLFRKKTFALHALKVCIHIIHVPIFAFARFIHFYMLYVLASVHFGPFHIRGFYQKRKVLLTWTHNVSSFHCTTYCMRLCAHFHVMSIPNISFRILTDSIFIRLPFEIACAISRRSICMSILIFVISACSIEKWMWIF